MALLRTAIDVRFIGAYCLEAFVPPLGEGLLEVSHR